MPYNPSKKLIDPVKKDIVPPSGPDKKLGDDNSTNDNLGLDADSSSSNSGILGELDNDDDNVKNSDKDNDDEVGQSPLMEK